jgi:L-methionine (R)-S-oxide reductase
MLDTKWQAALEGILERVGSESGTVHLLGDDGLLGLVASVGIPPSLIPVIASIPVGKGMAGLAVQRDAPVESCNLQTDESGDVRPGSRATRLRGSVAVPIRDKAGLVRGCLGVGVVEERVYTDPEIERLLAEGSRLLEG